MPDLADALTAAEVTANYLTQQGLGIWPPIAGGLWPIWHASMPATPVEAIGVHDTTPVTSGRALDDVQRHPGVMVHVRSSYPTGGRKMAAIVAALDALDNWTYTEDGLVYTMVSAKHASGPMPLGRDPTGNYWLWSYNFTTTITSVPAA